MQDLVVLWIDIQRLLESIGKMIQHLRGANNRCWWQFGGGGFAEARRRHEPLPTRATAALSAKLRHTDEKSNDALAVLRSRIHRVVVTTVLICSCVAALLL